MHDFEYICQLDGIKNGFDIMIAILPLKDNIQAEVNLAIGKAYQTFKDLENILPGQRG
jgi:hypothetical protein